MVSVKFGVYIYALFLPVALESSMAGCLIEPVGPTMSIQIADSDSDSASECFKTTSFQTLSEAKRTAETS